MRRLSHFIFHSFIPLFLSVPIHPSDGKKPGSENFELVAMHCVRELKKISQEPKKLVKFFILYLDNR